MAFDFSAVAAPFRMQPGLRRLAAGTAQLSPLRLGDAALLEKLAVLGAFSAEALVAADGFDATPAVRALVAHASTEQPDALRLDAGSVLAPHLGWGVVDGRVAGDGPPEIGAVLAALDSEWRLAGLLSLAFAEDFAILDGATGRIPWLAVCLPSNWAPEEKVGRPFAEVHAPVADNAGLIAAASHLTRLVTGDERWERFVWTVTDDPRLHRHPRRAPTPSWPLDAAAERLASQAFFRTERQTFLPLPALRQAVFTIHVEVRPLAEVIDSAGRARQVRDALASMSPAVLAYRGLGVARDRLLAWLETRAISLDVA